MRFHFITHMVSLTLCCVPYMWEPGIRVCKKLFIIMAYTDFSGLIQLYYAAQIRLESNMGKFLKF
jgi:hypothetical protein